MKNINKIITLLALILSTTTNAQDIFIKKNIFSQHESVAEKLQIITQKNTVGEYPIIKIGDEMRLIWTKVTYSTGTVVPLGRAVIFTSKGKKVLHTLDMTANLAQANSSDWTDEPCKRDNFLWKRSLGGNFKDINCASINHIVNHFVTPTGEFQQILVAAKDEGIEIPPTIIRVTFTRYTSSGRRLVYNVDVNPEQYGIDRDATTPWGSNGWYKDFIQRDPKKVDFLENLKKWATDVQDKMELAFNKDPMAFSSLKPIEEYMTEKKSKNSIDKEKPVNIEEKLSMLKSIFTKGLLTETQYNEQVKTLLESIK
jgi:hypothetical protein